MEAAAAGISSEIMPETKSWSKTFSSALRIEERDGSYHIVVLGRVTPGCSTLSPVVKISTWSTAFPRGESFRTFKRLTRALFSSAR